MSRKLLMCDGKQIGFIYDKYFTTEKAAGTITFEEGENLTPAYSYGYLLEAKGASSFPGATRTRASRNAHTVAEFNNDTGKYDYTIISTSSNGTKTKSVNFSLDILLDEVDRSSAYQDAGIFSDRLYWDEASGEYLIERNTRHEIFTNSDEWAPYTAYDVDVMQYSVTNKGGLYLSGSNTTIPIQLNTNYYKMSPNDFESATNWSVCALTASVRNIMYNTMLGIRLDEATKEQLDSLFAIPMHLVYAITTEIIYTGKKKKIKVPIFDEGTTFGLQHTDIYYDGDEVTGEQVTYGSIKIEVPCTDAIVYESFEGTSITPSIVSDTHVFYEDESIYLEEVTGIHTSTHTGGNTATYNMYNIATLGVPTDDGKYEYTVTATSADGTKSKNVSFVIDYQLIHYGEPNKMYWNDELGCYDVLMHSGYEYVTDITGWGMYIFGNYTIFTKETDDGYIAYGTSNSNAVYANGTFISVGRNSISSYKHTITSGSDQNNSTIGLCIHDVHTIQDFNAVIQANTPIHIFYEYNSDKILHTDIKKKIKLPWFGEGTTYTFVNGDLSAAFKIGVPTKYEHKIAYKEYTSLKKYNTSNMTTTIQPTIKDIDVYDICYSYDSYIDTIINPVYLFDGGGYDVAVNNGDGTYSYNMEVTSRTINPSTGGAITTSLFTQEIKLPYRIDGWYAGTTYNDRDRFYWDDSIGQYMLEKNTMRLVINSAYGDVEFTPFSYSSYSLNYGNCWEFALPEGCDYDLINAGYNSTCMCNTNYQRTAMTTAYIYDDDGVIFHPDYHSTFEDYKSLVFHYQYATSLDLLDQQLKAKPLNLVLPLAEPMKIKTGIKKKITLPFTQSMCEVGVQVTMKNTDSAGTIINSAEGLTNGILTIIVPVEYKTVEVPEPTYQLPAKTVLTGSSSGGYINTNVKLFDTAKDSTVIIDFESVNASGLFTPDNGDIVFHCRYESSSYKYRGFSLVYENTYNSWRMMGDTTYNSGNLGTYQDASIDDSSSEGSSWRYRYAFIFKAGILDRAINLRAETQSSIDIPAPAKFYDEELYPDKAAFGTYTGTAYLGRKGTSSANYYQGTIHDCKIWDGIALTDEQIQALYESPYPKESFTVSNKTFAGNQTSQVTDNQLDTGVTIFDYGVTDVDFTIFLEFDKGTGGSGTPRVLCCSDTTSGYEFLSVHSEDSRETFNIRAYNSGDSKYYELLKNPLPSVNDHYKFFICYRAGMIDSVIDYSTGVPVRLELADILPTVPPSTSLTFYNVLLGAAPFSSLTDTRYVWGGTIKHCKIWKHKLLSSYDMDYVVNNVIK